MAAIFTVVSSVFLCIDYQTVVSFPLPPAAGELAPGGAGGQKLYGLLPVQHGASLLLHPAVYLFGDLCRAVAAAGALRFGHCRHHRFWTSSLSSAAGHPHPLGPFELLRGGYPLGLDFSSLYGIVTVVRNAIEPKLVGQEIGLHPLATITAMFLGLNLAGFGGMLTAPLAVLLIKHLNEEGIITLYRP